jgi:uncharacterized protein (TIGR03435 family)
LQAAGASLSLLIAVHAQPAGEEKLLEVSSVKPMDPNVSRDTQTGGIRLLPGHQTYAGIGVRITALLMTAFELGGGQLRGEPSWFKDDPYDITAKASRPMSSEEQHELLIELLVDRFQLKYHWETHEETAQVLSVGKDGPRLPLHQGSDPTDSPFTAGKVKIAAQGASMPELARRLSLWTNMPVVDETNLSGRYDFTLDFAIDNGITKLGDAMGDNRPPLPTALRKQLGLEVEAKKRPIKVFVVDHAEKPSPN